MAYDGFMAAAVLSEIKGSLEGAKIEKITQPEADQIRLSPGREGAAYGARF